MPVTCVPQCATKTRRPKVPTHQRPSQPCWSQDRLRCAPQTCPRPLAFERTPRSPPTPPTRTDRPSRTPFGSDRDAAARTVEVSRSGVPAGAGRAGAGGQRAPRLTQPGRGRPWCKSFGFGSVLGESGARHCQWASLRSGVFVERACRGNEGDRTRARTRRGDTGTFPKSRGDSAHPE